MRAAWVPHDTRDEVVDYVGYWLVRVELPAARLIKWPGISSSKYYDWKKRYGRANEHNGRVPRDHWLLDEEKQAIIRYHFDHPAKPHEHWHIDVTHVNQRMWAKVNLKRKNCIHLRAL